MSNPRELEYYLDRMSNAISRTRQKVRTGEGPAFEKSLFVAMFKDIFAEGNRLIEESTGNPHMLNGSWDSVKDDIDEAFSKAIEAEEQADEDARDPWLQEASRADDQRDEAA